MTSFTLMVVAIFIGVLVSRIILTWAFALRTYAETKVFIDLDQLDVDWGLFKQRVFTAFVSTLISIFFVILALEYLKDPLCKTSGDKHHVHIAYSPDVYDPENG